MKPDEIASKAGFVLRYLDEDKNFKDINLDDKVKIIRTAADTIANQIALEFQLEMYRRIMKG